MPGRIHLYVSAGPDMQQEREYVARAIARFPIPLGWELTYTPTPDRPAPPNPSLVQHSDLHIILLGRDIQAPVGWELWVSRGAGHEPLGFAQDVGRTPAGEVFYRDARVSWGRFSKPDELLRLVQRALARAILQDPSRFSLSVGEWETLTAFLEEREAPLPEAKQAELDKGVAGHSAAGHSAVVFSPTHHEPSGCVLLTGRGQKRKHEEEQ